MSANSNVASIATNVVYSYGSEALYYYTDFDYNDTVDSVMQKLNERKKWGLDEKKFRIIFGWKEWKREDGVLGKVLGERFGDWEKENWKMHVVTKQNRSSVDAELSRLRAPNQEKIDQVGVEIAATEQLVSLLEKMSLDARVTLQEKKFEQQTLTSQLRPG